MYRHLSYQEDQNQTQYVRCGLKCFPEMNPQTASCTFPNITQWAISLHWWFLRISKPCQSVLLLSQAAGPLHVGFFFVSSAELFICLYSISPACHMPQEVALPSHMCPHNVTSTTNLMRQTFSHNTNTDIKQYQTLRNATNHWPPDRFCIANNSPSKLASPVNFPPTL